MNEEMSEQSEIKKLKIEELFEKFASDKNGITNSAAKEKTARYGFNEISEKKSKSNCKIPKLFLGSDSGND